MVRVVACSYNFLFTVKFVISFVPKAMRKCGQFIWEFSVVSEFADIVNNIAYISGPDPMKSFGEVPS